MHVMSQGVEMSSGQGESVVRAAIAVLEQVPHPLLVVMGTRVVGATRAVEQLLGAGSGKLRGVAFDALFPSLTGSRDFLTRVDTEGGASRSDVECIRLDGKPLRVQVALRRLPEDQGGVLVVSLDDARGPAVRSFERLVESRVAEPTTGRLDASGTLAGVRDEHGRYLALSELPGKPSLSTRIGATDADLFGTSVARAVADSDALAHAHPNRIVVVERTSGSTPFRIYKVLLTIDGAPRLFALNADLTEEHALLAQFADAEARLRALLDASADLMFVLDRDGRFVDYHVGHDASLYRSADQFLGRTVEDVLPAPIAVEYARAVEATRRERRPQQIEYALDMRDGHRLYEARIVPYGEDRVVLVARDVTESRRGRALEQELARSQRLESLGVLAGGIAHDFNNLLGAIVGFGETLRTRLAGDAAAQALAVDILQTAFRGRDLVAQILAFARPKETSLVPLAPSRILDEAAHIVRAALPGTTIDVRLHEPVPTVLADASQLHRVIVNLATNAAQAMRGVSWPRIELGAARRVVLAGDVQAGGVPPGEYAVLSVRDEGVGMDPATRERMFDPFFTTRSPGEGTGLGLSVVHGIVRAHGGHLVVRSAPGKGTTVEVLLPATTADTAESSVPPAYTPSPAPASVTNPPRVLVVEDDANVARSFAMLLETLGMYPLVEPKPADAVERVTRDDVDIVVTDLAMPGMNGVELAEAIAARAPGLPVLLVTGGATSFDQAQLRAAGITATLTKPVAIDVLEDALAQALAKARKRRRG